MMRTLLLLAVLVFGGCGFDGNTPTPHGDDPTNNGESPDYCAAYGWYSDGVCDKSCPQPDPDCTNNVEPPPPISCTELGVPGGYYVAEAEACERSRFRCPAGEQYFSDDCGCGCVYVDRPPPPPNCPNPDREDVHYFDGSQEDPSICAAIRFACPEGQEAFSNECGCGCVGRSIEPPPPMCPAGPEVYYHADRNNLESCYLDDWGCPFQDVGVVYFDDPDCGCGCFIDEPTPWCPDPSDPNVSYVAQAEEYEVCLNADWDCVAPPGSEVLYFDDPECGCGCVIETLGCQDDADCPNGYCETFAACAGIGCPPEPAAQCVYPYCDDGSALLCDGLPTPCEPGFTQAVQNGCWACVDARTCGLQVVPG